jgi:CheY-like chemotaxis protein
MRMSFLIRHLQLGESPTVYPVLNRLGTCGNYIRPVRSSPPLRTTCSPLYGSTKLPARILVVDDNSAARTAIRSLLNLNSFQVCGEAQDGAEALEKVRELKPDIVLLDINMPGMNGVRAAARIRKIRHTKIVFLTIHKLPGTVPATRQWSDGFVSKSAAATELIPTLIQVARSVDGFTKRTRLKRARAS